MSRPPRRAEKKIEAQPPQITPEEPPSETPIATEKVTVVTTYRRQKPVTEEPPRPDAGEPEDFDEPEEADEPEVELLNPADELDLFLEELSSGGENPAYMAEIYRLPDYYKPNSPFFQQNHPKVRKISCGQLSVTTSLIEEIRQRWARPNLSNAFRVTVKYNGRILRNLHTLELEPPPPDEIRRQAAAPEPSAVTPFNLVMPEQNPMNSIREAVKLAKELTGLATTLPPAPAQTPGPGELPLEAALIRIVASDREMVSQAVSRLFGRENPAPAAQAADNGGSSFFGELGRALGSSPEIQQMIVGLTAALAGGVINRVVSGGQQPAAPAEPPPEQPPAQPLPSPEQHLLSMLLKACASQQPPQAVADWVLKFQEQYPQVMAYVEGFINLPADSALRILSAHMPQAAQLTAQSHTGQWTQAVQDALTNDEETKAGQES